MFSPKAMPAMGLVLVAHVAILAAGQLDPAESVLAIVTHKGGFAAALAHDHLIVAEPSALTLHFDASAPEKTEAELRLPAADLIVDDYALQQRWYPVLEKLEVLDRRFSEVSEKDRGKIRQSMLGKKQLDAKSHPEIRARIAGIRREPTVVAEVEFPFTVDLEFQAHGQTATRPLAARYETADGVTSLEAVGTFDFTDFGVRPYSAFLGSVKNKNTFHVYVHLRLD